MLREFRDFVNKGNVITVAVGLVMGLYFQQIVNAVIEGVINPIIAAIFGKSDFSAIGFDIGDARISIGLVINAVVTFIIVAWFLFFVIKAYNRYIVKHEDEVPSLATEVDLLTEIRDLLAAQRRDGGV